MNQKGNIFLSIILLGLVLMGAFLIYYYFSYLHSLGSNYALPTLIVTPSPKINQTTDWKQLTIGDVTLKYPPNWLSNNPTYISQYPFDPKVETNNVYNLVRVTKISAQLHPGYLNHEWFNKLYNLKMGDTYSNEFYPSDATKYETVSLGKVDSGERYIIFKASKTAENELFSYVLRDDTLYQLTLTKYDLEGETNFKKIVPSVFLN